MIFYRYMKSHWLKTLTDERFKMAKVSDFNDPFDGRGLCVGQLSREAARNFSKEANTASGQMLEVAEKTNASDLTDAILDTMVKKYSYGLYRSVQERSMVSTLMYVLCFSACNDNNPAQRLMWAHYANGYRGVRIGVRFDNPNFPYYLDSMKYCHERPVLDLSKISTLGNDPEILRFWISNLTTKSTEWAYEQEVRLIAHDSNLERGCDDNGIEAYFWRFNPQDIVSVDVGCQMPSDEINNLIELRNSKYADMLIGQVVINDFDYGISYKRIS